MSKEGKMDTCHKIAKKNYKTNEPKIDGIHGVIWSLSAKKTELPHSRRLSSTP